MMIEVSWCLFEHPACEGLAEKQPLSNFSLYIMVVHMYECHVGA
jgi:hypothetical protein